MLTKIKLMACGYNLVSLRFRLNTKGMGHTLANALRRVLLSTVIGWSVIGICIDNVNHELDRIDGIKEDAASILFNVKQIVFTCGLNKPLFKVLAYATNAGTLLAKHLIVPNGVLIKNGNQKICQISIGSKFRAELIVAQGLGYMCSSEIYNKFKKHLFGHLILDANFNPVKRVSFNIVDSEYNVDLYENIELIIETNGTVNFNKTIKHACSTLTDHFSSINNSML